MRPTPSRHKSIPQAASEKEPNPAHCSGAAILCLSNPGSRCTVTPMRSHRPDTQSLFTSPGRLLWVTLVLVLIKIALAVAFYDGPRIWLHGDDYSRALFALRWAADPFVFTPDMAWLPLPFYVYGAASWLLTGHYQLGFAVVTQAISILTLFPLIALTRRLHGGVAAALAGMLYVFIAWQVILSLSCMAEPLFYLLTLSAIYYLTIWSESRRARHLATAMIFFALGAATRYEGWILLPFVSIFVLLTTGRSRPRFRACLWLIIPWLVPAAWMVQSARVFGTGFRFYNVNRESFDSVLQGAGVFDRLLMYPQALLNISVLIPALFAVFVWRSRRRAPAAYRFVWIMLAGHFLILVGAYVGGSGPLFVQRVVLLHIILMLPFAGALLATWVRSRRRPWAVAAWALPIIFVLTQTYETRRILEYGIEFDYAAVKSDFVELAQFLKRNGRRFEGRVGVATPDFGACFIRIQADMPFRVVHIPNELDDYRLRDGVLSLIAVPIPRSGPLSVADAIEQRIRRDNVDVDHRSLDFGNWRLFSVPGLLDQIGLPGGP